MEQGTQDLGIYDIMGQRQWVFPQYLYPFLFSNKGSVF